jgi:hypothetical protein
MRWLWHEWNDETKPWAGLGTPCTPQDKELFAVATRVTIGNGKKVQFWEAPWLDGRRPKDIAPLIFKDSKRRKCTVSKAMENNSWVSQINMQDGLSVEHIVKFANLWELVSNLQMDPTTPDTISWKLTTSGCYSSKSAYTMQFLGHPNYSMPSLVWRPCPPPPKCKLFAWLTIQNRVWTADRLEKRGWQNCGRCKLCNQVQESASHMLYKCRFTICVWTIVKNWLGLHDVDPSRWHVRRSVKE